MCHTPAFTRRSRMAWQVDHRITLLLAHRTVATPTCRYKAVLSALEIWHQMIRHFIQWGLPLVLIIQEYKVQTPRIATRRRPLMEVTIIRVSSTVEVTTKGSREV